MTDQYYEIHFFEQGVLTDSVSPKKKDMKQPEHLKDLVRGDVLKWSSESRSRLRKVLLTKKADGDVYGLTFTVPGPILSADEWRVLFKKLGRFCSKYNIPTVWRIELQQRKQPHLHLITWGEKSFSLCDVWKKFVYDLGPCVYFDKSNNKVTCNRMSIMGAVEHCTDCDPVGDNPSRWWRYLCDHTSKSKQVQAGWIGRHWGIFNRKAFYDIVPDSYSLSEKEWFKFMRVLRRLTRSRKWRGSRGASVWFSNPATVHRIAEWAVSQ